MYKIPDEIILNILSYLPFNMTLIVDKYMQKLIKSNQVWGPRAFRDFGIRSSHNFFEEYKWQTKLRTYNIAYQRQYTLGCVGKIRPLGEKPIWKPAYTKWAPT